MNHLKIYTGSYGIDTLEEVFEKQFGGYRIYMKKVPRILRKIKNVIIKKSCYTGRWYRLMIPNLPIGLMEQVKPVRTPYKPLTVEDIEKMLSEI